MPLASRNDVLAMLRAPGGASPADLSAEAAGPAGAACGAKADGAEIPTLVDFDRSVIAADAASASRIRRVRRRGFTAWIKRRLSPEKERTRSNIAQFMAALRERAEQPRVLVIGGGTVGQGMGALYEAEDIALVAFDIYPTPDIHFIADAHAIPLADESVDGVVIQAVLEHVLEPHVVAGEIWRVLKPKGLVYAETPFMQQVHEGAYDFTRFTESGHRHLFRRFDRIASGSCGGPGIAFMWSVDYLARGLFRSRTAGKIAKLLVFWAQYLDRLIPEPHAIDGASGVFFLGAKSDRTLDPKEAVAHYRGAQ
jgi:SAM-dependent methyltransferase